MKKLKLAIIAYLLVISLCGCRTRTTLVQPELLQEPVLQETQASAEAPEPEKPEPEAPKEEPPKEEPEPPKEEPPKEEPQPPGEEQKPEEKVPEKPAPKKPQKAQPKEPEEKKPEEQKPEDPEPPKEEPEPQQPEEPPAEPAEPVQPSVNTEPEDTQRREYSSDSSGEINPEAETVLAAPGEGDSDLPTPVPGEGETVNAEGEGTDRTATETVPADDADKLGVDEKGEVADSVQTYYLTLLDSRLGALFECKRLYVYWETPEDHRTIYKTAREHKLITGAGAYDVSAKLLEENLTVDDGWIGRKNPDVIVKVMEGGALDGAAAKSLAQDIASRPGLGDTAAVREKRVLVLSEKLLSTNAGRTAAMLYLAKMMYPDQMEDVDPDEALKALAAEAGSSYSGSYASAM
ncbi:MAG: hypothetical protein IJM17_05735 [Firmicutes bacterium]|nr:hypothetical protein [Bacillota bacterium]